jgi:hypothetical protein
MIELKCEGNIKQGDLVYLSKEGIARKAYVHDFVSIIGIALEDMVTIPLPDGKDKVTVKIETELGKVVKLNPKIIKNIPIGEEAYYKNGSWTSDLSMFNSNEYVWCGFTKLDESHVILKLKYIFKKV